MLHKSPPQVCDGGIRSRRDDRHLAPGDSVNLGSPFRSLREFLAFAACDGLLAQASKLSPSRLRLGRRPGNSSRFFIRPAKTEGLDGTPLDLFGRKAYGRLGRAA